MMKKTLGKLLLGAVGAWMVAGLCVSTSAFSADEPKKQEAEKRPAAAAAKQDAKAAPQKLSPLMAAAKAAQENREAADKKTPTFTNADLTQRFGSDPVSGDGVYTNESVPAPVADPVVVDSSDGVVLTTLGDPMQAIQQQQADAAERAKKFAEAQTAVQTMTARIQELEKRKLAIVNPYLARPKIDKDDPQAKDWDGADAKTRSEQTQALIDDLRQQLAAAEKTLAETR